MPLSVACLNGHCTYCDGCPHTCHQPDQDGLFDPVDMNAVGSPTGRVQRDPADTSVSAAHRTGAASLREQVYTRLLAGMATSIEIAEAIPQIKVSNRAASRLGELWEEGRAAIVRERGVCVLGECRPHNKPHIIHKPTAPCGIHGKPKTRSGASLWMAL